MNTGLKRWKAPDKDVTGLVLVGGMPLWHSPEVKNRMHRCVVTLGMLAMALALFAVPAGVAFATATKPDMAAMADGSDQMPCDKSCPGCAKVCPDMGHCLLKCSQQLTYPPAHASVEHAPSRRLNPPALSTRIAEAPIPPLLRPPSV